MAVYFLDAVSIKVLHKSILSFLTVLAMHDKVPKITSLQFLRNDVLDYRDFW